MAKNSDPRYEVHRASKGAWYVRDTETCHLVSPNFRTKRAAQADADRRNS